MEATTTKTGAKTSKPAKAKGKKGKPATAKPVTSKASVREQFRAECAAHVEALAILSEAEAAVLALIGTDDKKSVFHHLDVVRSCVFTTFPA